MRKILTVTITDQRKASEKVRNKTFRMVELPNGTLVARDPAFPLDGPKVVEKARAKAKKATKLTQEKVK